MSKENGLSWIPSPGVVPVLNPKEQKWNQSRDEDAPTVARLLLESGAAERMEVWSTDAVRTVESVLLLGNSALPVHRWTLTRAMLEEKAPAWLTAFPDAIMEDPLNRAEQLALKGILEDVELPDGNVVPGGGSEWVVADFRRPLRLEDLPPLDRVHQRSGLPVLADIDPGNKAGSYDMTGGKNP